MKHEELNKGDVVIFKRYNDTIEREDFQDGYVIAVYPDIQKVDICWLEGYKSRADDVEYKKVIAKYDENGEEMKFGLYTGKSILLES